MVSYSLFQSVGMTDVHSWAKLKKQRFSWRYKKNNVPLHLSIETGTALRATRPIYCVRGATHVVTRRINDHWNMERQRIQKVWVDDKCVYARTSNGLVANYPFSMWKRFEGSTPSQRQDFYLSYSGIHWPQLDEDLSFEGMFAQAGLCTRTETEDTIYWEA